MTVLGDKETRADNLKLTPLRKAELFRTIDDDNGRRIIWRRKMGMGLVIEEKAPDGESLCLKPGNERIKKSRLSAAVRADD